MAEEREEAMDAVVPHTRGQGIFGGGSSLVRWTSQSHGATQLRLLGTQRRRWPVWERIPGRVDGSFFFACRNPGWVNMHLAPCPKKKKRKKMAGSSRDKIFMDPPPNPASKTSVSGLRAWQAIRTTHTLFTLADTYDTGHQQVTFAMHTQIKYAHRWPSRSARHTPAFNLSPYIHPSPRPSAAKALVTDPDSQQPTLAGLGYGK
ncbi:hypothetical protein MAPG_02020 [Magnaporthiopsis poae ATCC 64411]|uniref:Uncharacterized protein n=1 Tax=Magnaporthiopsis poae (strain ATCC 64411 / 73-15) TaxID=644358 RepID=A0A0C4DQ82_MAGP6|nr:hypothetical protein MAPG_02020 [Magnaporthiopsis poae ATCC 64411]